MPNTLLSATAVTREALRVLHGKLRFISAINRQYDKQFAREGAKIGDTLKIRLPNQYVVRSGATLASQDTAETSALGTRIGQSTSHSSSFSRSWLTCSVREPTSRSNERSKIACSSSSPTS